MTVKQKKLYWFEFGKVRDHWLQAGGLTAAETDRRRHTLQHKALGYERSSTKLTNREFDAVIAAFRAEASPDDFDAQMQVQDSPDRLRTEMLGRCNTAMEAISPEGTRYGNEQAREGYLATIAKSVDGHLKWPPREAATLRKVMGIVERRAAIIRQKATRQKVSTPTPEPFDQENPF